MKSGSILTHKISGTFAELVEFNDGFSLKFIVRSFISKTRSYSADEILKDWRIANKDELELFNKGKLSIK